jgi:hypothetical protein
MNFEKNSVVFPNPDQVEGGTNFNPYSSQNNNNKPITDIPSNTSKNIKSVISGENNNDKKNDDGNTDFPNPY